MDVLNLKLNDKVKYWEEKTCIHTIIAVNDRDITLQSLAPVFDFLKRNDLSLKGDVLIKTILTVKNEILRTVYYDVWLPIM
ncbi:MAG: hypothetical protein PHP29_05055 [Tissierellia bacterium]|nr:hypothetical protein [Tissierellia bacterium]MDD4089043.1 hypothetical protein [Tissierellia bacterium]